MNTTLTKADEKRRQSRARLHELIDQTTSEGMNVDLTITIRDGIITGNADISLKKNLIELRNIDLSRV